MKLMENIHNYTACFSIKSTCRLIGKDKCRIVCHCSGNSNSLLLSA